MTNKCARNTFMKQVYFVIAIMLSFITTVHAESWGAVIPAVEKRAAFYLAEADRLGYANTSKSDVDYLDYYREDHECGILGRMLDLADVVADDERLGTPRIADDLSDIEIIQLFAAGRTLESWVRQANQAISQTKEERVQHWNQSCAQSERFEYAPSLLMADVPSFNAFAISNPKDSNLKTPTEPITMPDFEGRDKSARMFRTRIRNGLAEGANFNGHYSFITFGCGTSCVLSYIADTRTGKVFEPPFGGESTPELAIEFKFDSNLIQVIHMSDTSEKCQVRAWSFDGKGFNLEGEDVFAREGSCNYGQKLVSR